MALDRCILSSGADAGDAPQSQSRLTVPWAPHAQPPHFTIVDPTAAGDARWLYANLSAASNPALAQPALDVVRK